MAGRFQGLKGMPDVVPPDTLGWLAIEDTFRNVVARHGYMEIRFPILESTSLFKRTIGEVTDIVAKEMFTFQDKDNESITLRPEGTAGCVRAGIEHGLLYNQIQRFWLMGPMFRYEKPQMGRYRQFHQLGIEAFGLKGPDIEVEQIALTVQLFKEWKIDSAVKLEINTLGSEHTRARYREKVVEYFSKYYNDLDEDSQKRLQTNPLRILDSKHPKVATLIKEAPQCYDYLEGDDKGHFEAFQGLLQAANIEFTVNPRIVRGLDYYNRSVYEWVTDKLGAQSAVCAGGRYDGLVASLGGQSTPAVGFAIGIERILLLQQNLMQNDIRLGHPYLYKVYIVAVGQKTFEVALNLSIKLRDNCPELTVILNCGGGDFKTQFKRADKSGAALALVLGEEELAGNEVKVKFLREEREQVGVTSNRIAEFLRDYFQLNVGRKTDA